MSFLLRLSLFILLLSGGPGGVSHPVASAQDDAPDREASAHAERSGTVGAGVQVGEPGGVTLKWYRRVPVTYTATLTTDGEDYVLLLANRLWEARLRNSPLRAYIGPGVTLGGTTLDRRGTLAAGLNGTAGLNFYVEPFEVFLQVTPRVRFLPHRVDDVGGSVGLRLYL
jgi:hypothetical protein